MVGCDRPYNNAAGGAKVPAATSPVASALTHRVLGKLNAFHKDYARRRRTMKSSRSTWTRSANTSPGCGRSGPRWRSCAPRNSGLRVLHSPTRGEGTRANAPALRSENPAPRAVPRTKSATIRGNNCGSRACAWRRRARRGGPLFGRDRAVRGVALVVEAVEAGAHVERRVRRALARWRGAGAVSRMRIKGRGRWRRQTAPA